MCRTQASEWRGERATCKLKANQHKLEGCAAYISKQPTQYFRKCSQICEIGLRCDSILQICLIVSHLTLLVAAARRNFKRQKIKTK